LWKCQARAPWKVQRRARARSARSPEGHDRKATPLRLPRRIPLISTWEPSWKKSASIHWAERTYTFPPTQESCRGGLHHLRCGSCPGGVWVQFGRDPVNQGFPVAGVLEVTSTRLWATRHERGGCWRHAPRLWSRPSWRGSVPIPALVPRPSWLKMRRPHGPEGDRHFDLPGCPPRPRPPARRRSRRHRPRHRGTGGRGPLPRRAR
jgi:hypothetical protein